MAVGSTWDWSKFRAWIWFGFVSWWSKVGLEVGVVAISRLAWTKGAAP